MSKFKQVFLIQAHTDAKFLYRLVKKLESPTHYFAIHIDKKSRLMFDDNLVKELSYRSDTLVINDYDINWGGANQFFATLRLIEKSISHWPDLDYFHLISGQDFPIKNNDEIDRFFEKHKDSNFMSLTTNPHLNYRYDIFHPRDIINTRNCSHLTRFVVNSLTVLQQKLLDLGIRLRRKIPFEIFKGSQWWSLNRRAIDYINQFLKENPGFKSRFKYTNCCDEIFFQTILCNSDLRQTLIEDDLRYIDWSDNGRGFPNILDETDYSKIKDSRDFFCRKIISGKSDKLIDLLDNV